MILFFDTETSGLWRRDLREDHIDQPHLVSLAAQMCDNNEKIVHQISFVFNPGFFNTCSFFSDDSLCPECGGGDGKYPSWFTGTHVQPGCAARGNTFLYHHDSDQWIDRDCRTATSYGDWWGR